jgi:hypothetical protein
MQSSHYSWEGYLYLFRSPYDATCGGSDYADNVKEYAISAYYATTPQLEGSLAEGNQRATVMQNHSCSEPAGGGRRGSIGFLIDSIRFIRAIVFFGIVLVLVLKSWDSTHSLRKGYYCRESIRSTCIVALSYSSYYNSTTS